MFIAVCTCGQGIVDEDRDAITGKLTAHLTGRFYQANPTVIEHAGWIGTADAKLSIDVKTEAP